MVKYFLNIGGGLLTSEVVNSGIPDDSIKMLANVFIVLGNTIIAVLAYMRDKRSSRKRKNKEPKID